MKLKYIIPILLLGVALFTLGSYRYTPYHGGMYMYESDDAVDINTANVYHLLDEDDWQAGGLQGFTFNEGRVVDADITNEVDGSPQHGSAFAFDTVTEYYCPKCGSTDISRICTDPPPKVVRKSMDQLTELPIFTTTLEMRYTNMKAVCNKCGYEVKYSMPF